MLGPTEGSKAAVPVLYAEIAPSGVVEFESVVAGSYRASVHCADHTLVEGPSVLEVHGTETHAALWKVAPGLGLSIRVLDDSNAPVPAASFLLQLPALPGVARPTMVLTADANGRHVYPTLLKPGRYTLLPNGAYRGEPVNVDLKEGMGTADVTLKIHGSGSVLVTVSDKRGAPVEGIGVTAMPLISEPSDPASSVNQRRLRDGRAAAPLGNGRYRIGPLEPGQYEVRIEDNVNPPVSATGTPKAVVTIRSGASLQTRVTLDRGESIRGRVVDDSGGPVRDVWVSATYDAADDRALTRPAGLNLPGSLSASQRVLTGADGRFRLGGLSRGAHFTVRAEQPHGAAAVQRDAEAGADILIKLPAVGILRGSAFDSKGAIVTRFSVQATHVESGHTRAASIVTATGEWSLERVVAGRVQIVATDEEGRTAAQEIELGAGQQRTGIQLAFHPAADPALSAGDTEQR
jgi:hypothetical protein